MEKKDIQNELEYIEKVRKIKIYLIVLIIISIILWLCSEYVNTLKII